MRRSGKPERRGEGAHRQRLARAGHAFDQRVAARKECDQQPKRHALAADDGDADRAAHARRQIGNRSR